MKSGAGTITVPGSGRVRVAPDVAELRLGVSIFRPSVAEARQEAASTMANVLAAVVAADIAPPDVRTALLSVQPRYDYRDDKAPSLTGYEMSNAIEVTVRDLGRLVDVIDGSLRAGATSLDSLSFRLSDPVPAEREARERAMASARDHAAVLARAAGLKITGVASVVEDGVGVPRPFAGAEKMMMVADASTPIESGSLEVAVEVTVSYTTAGG